MISSKNKWYVGSVAALLFVVFALISCELEQETEPTEPQPSVGVQPSQVITRNTIVVAGVVTDESADLAVYRDNGSDAPDMNSMLFSSVSIESGYTDSITFTINADNSVADGEKLWFVLQDQDGNVMEHEGGPAQAASTIILPKIEVEDQTTGSNTVTMNTVAAGTASWLVVHIDDGEGNPGDVVGYTSVSRGEHSDVAATLQDDILYAADTTLYPMVHRDEGTVGEFSLNDDPVEIAGADAAPVITNFKVLPPTGELYAEDQVLSQNAVQLDSVEMSDAGWVVFRMGQQLSSTILSDTMGIEAGQASDVMVPYNPEEGNPVNGQQVWVTLHTDNGTIGDFQHPSQEGFDAPLEDDVGAVVRQSVQITAPSVTANNQAIAADSTITVASVTPADSAWIVLHQDDGTGGPGAILGYARVYPPMSGGTDTMDVEVKITADVEGDGLNALNGETLFAMLHVDMEPYGELNFPGGDDVPEVFGFDGNMDPVIVMDNFMVTGVPTP